MAKHDPSKAEQIATHMIDAYRKPMEIRGKPIAGDAFYSDIQARLRRAYGRGYPSSLFLLVCNRLQAAGYYVHS